MKKFFLLFLALSAVAFAGEGESMIKAYSVVAAGVGLYRVRAVGRAPRAADAGSGHSSPTCRTATQRPAAGLVGMHYGRPTARVTPTGAITRRGLLRSQRKPNRRLPAGPPALGNP